MEKIKKLDEFTEEKRNLILRDLLSMKEKKKVVVLVSGGSDSLSSMVLIANTGHIVQPLRIKFRVGGGKYAKEKKVINLFYEELKDRYPNLLEPVFLEDKKHRMTTKDYDHRDRNLVKWAGEWAGENFDVIYFSTIYKPEAMVDGNVLKDWDDMNPENLQEQLQPGQKIATQELEKVDIFRMVRPIIGDLIFKTQSCQMWWKKECGRCYRCIDRHASLLVAYGCDLTEYIYNPQNSKYWSRERLKKIGLRDKEIESLKINSR